MALTTSVLYDDGGVVLLALCGELDMETVGQVHLVVAEVLADGFTHLVIDLTGLNFCDSSGLGALLRAERALQAVDGRCIVAGATGPVQRLLAITDMHRVLDLAPEVGPALLSCRRDSEPAGDTPDS